MLYHSFQCWMDLGDSATVGLLSGPFFLDGERVFDGSDGSIGIPREDDPPRVRHCYRDICPLISRHFSQDLWKQPPRTLDNIVLHTNQRFCFTFVLGQSAGCILMESLFVSLTWQSWISLRVLSAPTARAVLQSEEKTTSV